MTSIFYSSGSRDIKSLFAPQVIHVQWNTFQQSKE
jgi:hypothetical protein